MIDRGYNNFYTLDEYESYQQYPLDNYGHTPYLQSNYYPLEPYMTSTLEENLMKYEQMTIESVVYTEANETEARLEDTLIKFMEIQQQYQEKTNARLKNLENQVGQLAKQLANNNNQGGTFQTNTQTIHDEKEKNLTKNEECGECVEEYVVKNKEERIVERGGVAKKVKEMEAPHEIELPQELPNTEEANTVDNEEVMMDAEVIEGLFDKGESCEQKKEIENKAEIDRIIEEICALFEKKELRRIWTPQNIYLKFMEFLPNQRKKRDDVFSVSFWPP
ncbi:hypothetical protein QL285_022557 [Trifolium repens]|nr:hypothetical protein QL285_022557 [Trifolium repens]